MKTQLTKDRKLILARVSRCQIIYITIALLRVIYLSPRGGVCGKRNFDIQDLAASCRQQGEGRCSKAFCRSSQSSSCSQWLADPGVLNT